MDVSAVMKNKMLSLDKFCKGYDLHRDPIGALYLGWANSCKRVGAMVKPMDIPTPMTARPAIYMPRLVADALIEAPRIYTIMVNL